MNAPRLATLLALVATPALAHAGVVSHTQLTEGQTAVSLNADGVGIDATASPRAFKAKTVNGVTGVGVEGGVVDGEIDLCEIMTFHFDEPVFITALTITHLFTDGQFGDHPAEVARFVTDAGTCTLEATTSTIGTWSGDGTLDNLSIATTSGAGEWMAYTGASPGACIFGSPITWLSLESGNPGAVAARADYSFVELSFTPVPAPGTLSAMGLAAGLLTRRRRSIA